MVWIGRNYVTKGADERFCIRCFYSIVLVLFRRNDYRNYSFTGKPGTKNGYCSWNLAIRHSNAAYLLNDFLRFCLYTIQMTKTAVPASPSVFKKNGFMHKIINHFQHNDLIGFFSKNISKSYTREEAFSHIIVAALALITLGLYGINKSF